MDTDEEYRLMFEWSVYRRRHNASVFDVLFRDLDDLTDEELKNIVSDVSAFFNLEIDVIHTHCNTLAKVIADSDGNNTSELYYNWQLLRNEGMNSRDAFTLCMVHEIAHLYLKGRRFMLCKNERWCHELAADYIVGLYAGINCLATGKYKYVVGHMKCTLTHPDGRHRADIVDYARLLTCDFQDKDIDTLLVGLPAFVYGRSRILNKELDECIDSINHPKPTQNRHREYDISELPDDNLIKQYWIKHRNKEI